jgi:hypothetical protein
MTLNWGQFSIEEEGFIIEEKDFGIDLGLLSSKRRTLALTRRV